MGRVQHMKLVRKMKLQITFHMLTYSALCMVLKLVADNKPQIAIIAQSLSLEPKFVGLVVQVEL